MIRVLLADDHALVRSGFRAILGGLENVEVVGEAGDGHEALALAGKMRPDILLVDIAMPGLNGLDVAARVAKEFPEVRPIILSMHANEEYVLQALRAGARGYLLKDAEIAELELAIRSVMKDRTFLSPSISRQVIDDYLARTGKAGSGPQSGERPFGSLTPRQREVLQLITEGLTTKQIAQKLNLSVKTVDAHRTQIMDRLDIHDIAGLVRYAVRTGIVQPE